MSRKRAEESVGNLADNAVLRTVYDDHAGELFALAYRSLGDRGRAEEVVQETFLRAWRGADRFDRSVPPSGPGCMPSAATW